MSQKAGWALAALAASALVTALPVAAQTPSATPSAMPSGMQGMGMPPAESGPVVTVALTENGKAGGTPGEAVISQRGSDVLVTLKDPTPGTAPRNAAIYKGTCATNGTPTHKLTPVTNGTSQTTLKGAKVSDLTSGSYSVGVGDSPRMCGELTQANPIPATKQ